MENERAQLSHLHDQLVTPMTIYDNRWQSMMIDENKIHKIFRHRLIIDFQYQLINWHQLLSIDIDYHRLFVSSIDHVGSRVLRLIFTPVPRDKKRHVAWQRQP